MNNDSSPPLFVVGASRSGTTLVQLLFIYHSDFHMVGETHYFDDLRPRLSGKESGSLDQSDFEKCRDYFSKFLEGYALDGNCTNEWMSKNYERLVRETKSLGGGSDHFFSSFCRAQADFFGKSRWGEKTPRHLFRIDQIMRAFPEARVLCMVRDPRSVIASYKGFSEEEFCRDNFGEEEIRRRQLSYHPILLSLMWKNGNKRALAARKKYGSDRVYLLQYEQLCSTPEISARSVFNWAGLSYEKGITDRLPKMNSSLGKDPDTENKQGITKTKLNRWKEVLTPEEIRVIQTICAKVMSRFDYELEPVESSNRRYLMLWPAAIYTGIRSLWANRKRIANPLVYIRDRMTS